MKSLHTDLNDVDRKNFIHYLQYDNHILCTRCVLRYLIGLSKFKPDVIYQIFQELITMGIDVNILPYGAYTSGESILHSAVVWERHDIIQLLLDNGALLEVGKEHIIFPAIRKQNTKVIDLCLEKINKENFSNKEFVMKVIEASLKNNNKQVLENLYNKNLFDINYVNAYEFSLLMSAIYLSPKTSTFASYPHQYENDCVKFLIEKGAYLDYIDANSSRNTAIMIALSKQDTYLVYDLLEHALAGSLNIFRKNKNNSDVLTEILKMDNTLLLSKALLVYKQNNKKIDESYVDYVRSYPALQILNDYMTKNIVNIK